MNDQTIEQEIQAKGLTAPRVTPADIEENIVGEFYFTAGSATRGASMEQVAEVAHEVNRAYCQALGDATQPRWNDAPEWQRASARMGVDLHEMGDFGPEASHISWMNQKLEDGWKYGALSRTRKQKSTLASFRSTNFHLSNRQRITFFAALFMPSMRPSPEPRNSRSLIC